MGHSATHQNGSGCSESPAGGAAPRAKKSLGQNFLKDANIAARIAAQLRIAPEDWVIEIGPGPGALTRHIHAAGPERLFLLEKDHHWAGEHKRRPSTGAPRA